MQYSQFLQKEARYLPFPRSSCVPSRWYAMYVCSRQREQIMSSSHPSYWCPECLKGPYKNKDKSKSVTRSEARRVTLMQCCLLVMLFSEPCII